MKHLLFAAFVLPSFLSSCGSFHADVTNPTVAQMDALDVQWGLPPRKPKGGARNNSSAASTPAKPAAVDPAVIQSLR